MIRNALPNTHVRVSLHHRPRSLRRLATRAILTVLCSGAMLLATRSIAQAHASLVKSEPAANAHLSASLSRVRLLFSEEIEPTLAKLSLVSDDGSVTPLVVGGDPHDVHAIIASVRTLPTGSYRLVWRVVSADGHPVEGSIVFWIGDSAAQVPPSAPASLSTPSTWGPTLVGAPIIPAVLRGAGLGFLMALAGLLLCMTLPRTSADPVQYRAMNLARQLALAGAVVLTFHLGAWIMNATPDHHLTSESTAALLASTIGKIEMWRTGLAILAAWALVLARRARLGLAFAVAALCVSGATGHSAAFDPRWAEPARALHLLAGGAWIGGLLYLIAYDPDAAPTFTRDALRVSTIALIAATIVILSGVVQAWLFLATPWDLFSSAYGAVLLAKILGFLILIAFGAYHRYRVLPRLASDSAASGRFAGTVRSELIVMVAVILLGGVLAYVSPPHHAATHDLSHVSTYTQ